MSIEVFSPESSSVIRHFAWDSSTNCLAIMFHSGTVWIYQNISDQCYKEFREAKSLGSYFNKNIRDVYPAFNAGNINNRHSSKKENNLGEKE